MRSRLINSSSAAHRALVVITGVAVMLPLGCRQSYREDLDYSYEVKQTWPMEDLHFGEIVQFESVFWEPADTLSLRK